MALWIDIATLIRTTDFLEWLTQEVQDLCWQCNQDRSEADAIANCPHCGADCTPF